jgi:NADH-quinone oxidoreductase subunit N
MFANYISKASLLQNLQSLPFLRSELVLVAVLILIILVDLIVKKQEKAFLINTILFAISLIVIGFMTLGECFHPLYNQMGAFFTKYTLYENGELQTVSDSMLTFTKQASFLKFLMVLASLILLIFNYLSFKIKTEKEKKSEYYVAIIALLLGSFLMLSSSHFLSLLLAIEISSFGAYALIYTQSTKKSKEATLKYILYGLTATALMLFGMSLLYAELGGLSYNSLISRLMVHESISPLLLVALFLFVLGLLFKLGAVPMYFWIPDVFEGGAMSSLAFLSLVPKFAVLGNFILLFSYCPQIKCGILSLQEILMLIGVITLTIGNFFALGQDNIKRLLGYSSVAHSGFLLIAFAIFGVEGWNSLLFYALVYVFMNFTTFICAEYFCNITQSDSIKNWQGMGSRNVFWAVLLTFGLLALIGLPPTAGFNAKLFIFTALIDLYGESQNVFYLIILIIAAFNIIIALFYYLKIPFYLFFKKTDREILDKTSLLSKLQVLLVAMPLIALFLFSGEILELIKKINDIVKYLVQ